VKWKAIFLGEKTVDLLAKDVTFGALAKGLKGLSARQQAIASNIANVNTEGYKRRDVSFSDDLANALEVGGTRSERSAALNSLQPREIVEDQLFNRADMNGVDLDREMAEQAKANLMYSALSQFAQMKIRQLRMVIRDGRP
jgi:flagellar basal-body rod protein FlgB